MKENYVYPAKVKRDEGKCRIKFLDFPDIFIEWEDTMEEAVKAAQEQLALTILDYEAKGKKPPKPCEADDGVIFIHIWMPYYRNSIKPVYVRKNVTIPLWVDILAKNMSINFSAVLTEALMKQIISDTKRDTYREKIKEGRR